MGVVSHYDPRCRFRNESKGVCVTVPKAASAGEWWKNNTMLRPCRRPSKEFPVARHAETPILVISLDVNFSFHRRSR